MKRYVAVYAGLAGVMLAVFVLTEALDLPYLTDPDPLRGHRGALAAVVGVALLVADVVLPVPASVVMVAHGALFGAVLGSAISMVGTLGAFGVGFALGRWAAPVVASGVPEGGHLEADRLVSRWGHVAIVVSRPIPILAEAVAFAAGTSSLRWRSSLGAAALGSLPAAAAYAAAGTAASSSDGTALFIVVGGLPLGAIVLVMRWQRRRSRRIRARSPGTPTSGSPAGWRRPDAVRRSSAARPGGART